ncbi:hypothetical protein [Sphaerisporangium sp. NPDC051011]|uniref:hypothetical protein n=1 Tax=Sphaerisporangium sp. NPDC051011 TaxID=3155792 RepID=UPI0033D42712
MTDSVVINVFVVIGIVGGAVALVYKGGRFAMGIYRRISNFLDDWNGEPARPGVEERPGFPARIAAVEKEMAGVKAIVSNGLSHNVKDIQERVKGLEESLNRGEGS